MLKNRVITGLILLVVALSFLIFASASIFFYVTAAIFLYLGWEWRVLLGAASFRAVWVYFICFVALLIASPFVPLAFVLWASVMWWLIAFFLVMLYPKCAPFWSKSFIWRGLMGIFTLIPCWLAMNAIRQLPNGLTMLFYLLFIIWATDTGAYFVGKWKGRHLLSPKVSPKKTWEGLVGGVLLALIIAGLGALLLRMPFFFVVRLLVIALGASLVSVLGDLLESMLKREAGIKDTGHYLPGHGGLLDRLDSLTAAAPIFLLGLMWF